MDKDPGPVFRTQIGLRVLSHARVRENRGRPTCAPHAPVHRLPHLGSGVCVPTAQKKTKDIVELNITVRE